MDSIGTTLSTVKMFWMCFEVQSVGFWDYKVFKGVWLVAPI